MEFEKKLISGAVKGILTHIVLVSKGKLNVYQELTEIKRINTPAVIVYLDSIDPDAGYANASLNVSFELLILVGDKSPKSRLECADICSNLIQLTHAEYIPFNGSKGLVEIQDATPVEVGLKNEQFAAWRVSGSLQVNNMGVDHE